MTGFIDAAREVATGIASVTAASVDEAGRFPQESFDALKAEKLLGMMVPAGAGGGGASLRDVVSVCHRLGQACGSTAMIFAMHQIQVACIVRHGATSAWHSAFLRALAEKQLLLGSATSEAGIGGDVRRSICAVETDGDGFVLKKEATVISYGAEADAILVTARRTPDSAASDQVIVVVPKDKCRLERRSRWNALGMRGTCSDGFDLDCRGSVEQILPLPYADISTQTMLPVSHLVWSAVWLGITTDAVARARTFVRAAARRNAGSLPPGGRRFAAARDGLMAMRRLLSNALARYEAALQSPEELSSLSLAVEMNSLKVGLSRLAVETVGEALQTCGLAGYLNDSPYSVGRHLRDVHSARLMINNDRIEEGTATLVLGLPEDRDFPA